MTQAPLNHVMRRTIGTWPPSKLSTTYPVTAGCRTLPMIIGLVMVPRMRILWPPAAVTCWAAQGVRCSWGRTVELSKKTSVAPVSMRASLVVPIIVMVRRSWEVVVMVLQLGSGGLVV